MIFMYAISLHFCSCFKPVSGVASKYFCHWCDLFLVFFFLFTFWCFVILFSSFFSFRFFGLFCLCGDMPLLFYDWSYFRCCHCFRPKGNVYAISEKLFCFCCCCFFSLCWFVILYWLFWSIGWFLFSMICLFCSQFFYLVFLYILFQTCIWFQFCIC